MAHAKNHDYHILPPSIWPLMGAAGAVIGPLMVVVAFFVAPFFGLGWALFQTFFKKIRQIPYGPFLSLAVLTVMILHDRIVREFAFLFLH